MANISHDNLFKTLLTTFFLEFLELFYPEVLSYLDPDSIEFVDKELFTDLVDGEKKVLDVVALTKFQEQNYSFLVHIEAQSSSQTDFNQRFFKYFCSLYLKYNRPIYPIVIFSYDSPQRPDTNSFVIDFPDRQVLKFDYQVVQLNRLNWRDFLKHKNPVAAALMSKMKIDSRDRPKVKAECLRLLVNLKLDEAKMYFISSFIDSYLQLDSSEEQIFLSEISKIKPLEQQKIMTITTSWEQKGRIKERTSLILRILTKKLGSLPSSVADSVSSLDETQSNALAEDLLDFDSLDDLYDWLDSH